MIDPYEVLKRVAKYRGITVPEQVLKDDSWVVKCKVLNDNLGKEEVVDLICAIVTRWEDKYGSALLKVPAEPV